VVSRDGLNRQDVRALLKEARPQPRIIEIVNRPIEKVAPWWEYRDRFLSAERISDGVRFWLDHKNTLEQISAQVPGAERNTWWQSSAWRHTTGANTGPYRALDALATLAFDYPPRQKFFRSELEEFLLLVKENKLDRSPSPARTPAPWACHSSCPRNIGAMQWLPTLTGGRDLWGDWDDILASVANYLNEHGWTAGGPVLAETRLEPDPSFQIEPHNLELNQTIESLAAHGVKVEMSVPADTAVVLISAEQRDGPAYRVGFHNFYVLTRYNASARYAMAVHELAQTLAQRMHDAAP